MFGDESFALRETVRMGGGDARFGWIGSLRHVCVEFDVHTDACESDKVLRVDQGVEVGDHVPFDVVLPGHDSPAVAVLCGVENLRHIVHGHQVEALRFEPCQLLGGIDGRLMGEGALWPQIEQLACAHCRLCLLVAGHPKHLSAFARLWRGLVHRLGGVMVRFRRFVLVIFRGVILSARRHREPAFGQRQHDQWNQHHAV